MTTDELRNKFENFKAIDDKWLFLLSLAKENKCTENIREDKWLIQGCSSKIWLKPSYVNNSLQFEVDGEYGISLGLAKLATLLYNGSTAQEAYQVDQNIFIEIGFIEWIKCDQEQWFYEHFKDYTNVYRSLQKDLDTKKRLKKEPLFSFTFQKCFPDHPSNQEFQTMGHHRFEYPPHPMLLHKEHKQNPRASHCASLREP